MINANFTKAAVEALHALYSRPYFSDEEYEELICPMYTTERVELLRKLYEYSIIDPEDIDDEKYLLSKKLSEVCSCHLFQHFKLTILDGFQDRQLPRVI